MFRTTLVAAQSAPALARQAPGMSTHLSKISSSVWRSRSFSTLPARLAQPGMLASQSRMGAPPTYFQRSTLPANTIIKFVPQQQAWVVERMGKFNRVLAPGVTILLPILDRIAYVQSLKETAVEIPSQSAITADNVTLELDGVLYTQVFDPYKARYSDRPLWMKVCL